MLLRKSIEGILAIVCRDKQRPNLCGVHVVSKDGDVKLAATDGRMMLVVTPTDTASEGNDLDVILSNEDLELAFSAFTDSHSNAGVRLHIDDVGETLSVGHPDNDPGIAEIYSKPIAGVFPKTSNVIPEGYDQDTANVSGEGRSQYVRFTCDPYMWSELVLAMAKALELKRHDSNPINFYVPLREGQMMIVDAENNNGKAIGALMPIHSGNPTTQSGE